jgi:hypothetical protein
VTHQFRRDRGVIRFETRAGDEVLNAVISYAFGSPDLYTSLVGNDDSEHSYIMRLSHYQDGRESGWVRTTGHSAKIQGAGDRLGKRLDAADGLYKCLFCHSTDPASVLTASGPACGDRAIGCERCHGPGGNHFNSVAAKFSDLAIASPAVASPEERMELCGQCHGRGQQSPLPRDNPFWIRFQSTTLTWSRCYAGSAQTLDCVTCHDPHRNANQPRSHYESRCLACHAVGQAKARDSLASSTTEVGPEDPSPATRLSRSRKAAPCPVNATQGCVACHMPPYRSEPLHATFTDHYIRVRRRGERIDSGR